MLQGGKLTKLPFGKTKKMGCILRKSDDLALLLLVSDKHGNNIII